MAFAMSLSMFGGVATSTLQVKAAATVNNPRIAEDVNLSSPYVTDAGTVNSEGNVTEGTNSKKTSDKYKEPSVNSEGVVTWDCVYFGSYKQKAIVDKKPIEWRVLSVSGNDAFVVADKALNCKTYNDKEEEKTNEYGNTYTDYSCTWETCTLREWLNGTGSYASDDTAFIRAAFSNDERNAIIQTTVKNDDNSQYETEGGNDTTDSIYLLSIGEVSNADYGFKGTFNDMTKRAKATDYAYLNGLHFGNKFESNSSSNCSWRLRSPGESNGYATYVGGEERGLSHGAYVYLHSAIRPALHVDLSSLYVKFAGTVSSNGKIVTVEEIAAQKRADAVIAIISAIGTVTKDSKSELMLQGVPMMYYRILLKPK